MIIWYVHKNIKQEKANYSGQVETAAVVPQDHRVGLWAAWLPRPGVPSKTIAQGASQKWEVENKRLKKENIPSFLLGGNDRNWYNMYNYYYYIYIYIFKKPVSDGLWSIYMCLWSICYLRMHPASRKLKSVGNGPSSGWRPCWCHCGSWKLQVPWVFITMENVSLL